MEKPQFESEQHCFDINYIRNNRLHHPKFKLNFATVSLRSYPFREILGTNAAVFQYQIHIIKAAPSNRIMDSVTFTAAATTRDPHKKSLLALFPRGFLRPICTFYTFSGLLQCWRNVSISTILLWNIVVGKSATEIPHRFYSDSNWILMTETWQKVFTRTR